MNERSYPQLSATGTTLIVGVGSRHGDDCLGWLVAEQLFRRLPPAITVRSARSPAQLLDWLGGVDRLMICDACCGSGGPGEIRRWEWPAAELPTAGWRGTHDLSLSDTLRLAERLGLLPPRVVIWTVEALQVDVGQDISEQARHALEQVIERIEGELVADIQRLTHA